MKTLTGRLANDRAIVAPRALAGAVLRGLVEPHDRPETFRREACE